jgi:RHS repeat-associated protein
MFDFDSQHYYNRARWYNPYNGRFNQMDPFAGNTQDPQSLHKYLYCHANPINGIDPSGLSLMGLTLSTLKVAALTMAITSIVGAGIGAAVGAYFHIVQNQTFEGIWTSVGMSAVYGAILGAILGGLSLISAQALAIGLAASFGINFYFTVKILMSPDMRPETKAAAVLFLLLQGVLSFRAIIGGFSGSGSSGTNANIAASTKQAAQGVEPGEAYIGYIDQSGKVGLIKANPGQGLYGHADAVSQGLIPKGSNGFSLVTNNEGQVVVLLGKSQLNAGFSLPTYLWNGIRSGFKSVLEFAGHSAVEN